MSTLLRRSKVPMAPSIIQGPQAACAGWKSLRRSVAALCTLCALAGMRDVFAASSELVTFLSPKIAGMPLSELHRRNKSMKCAVEVNDVRDCFLTLPLEVLQEGGVNNQVQMFVRAREGKVGQVIVSAPIGQLARVLGLLERQHGVPGAGLSVQTAMPASCYEFSSWQKNGYSVMVKACRNPMGRLGEGHFVVNLLTDRFAKSFNVL